MPETLIHFEKVSFAYHPNDVNILNNASFRLEPGERLALSGGNGCGKTTVFKLLTGLLLPISGDIYIFGKPRRNEKDFHEVRLKCGFLLQNSEDQLFCPTVGDDVAFGPMNIGLRRDEVARRVSDALEQLDLKGYENRAISRLSGGEKRLVALAGLLAMKPEILFLDEPGTGLDHDNLDQLSHLLNAFPGALIFVSHDKELRDAVQTRRIVLENGVFS